MQKHYKRNFNKDLIKIFANICGGDINKLYGYEYMDSWEQFDEMSLFDKKSFYSCLNMENITDFDNRHVKRAYQKFKRKKSGKHHALHVQSDTLLLIDVFENF